MSQPGPTGGGQYRVDVCYTGLVLVSPRGTIVSVYWPSERGRAEEDAGRRTASARRYRRLSWKVAVVLA